MKLSRRTLLSTPLAVVAPVGEVVPSVDASTEVSIKWSEGSVVRFDRYQWAQFLGTLDGAPIPPGRIDVDGLRIHVSGVRPVESIEIREK